MILMLCYYEPYLLVSGSNVKHYKTLSPLPAAEFNTNLAAKQRNELAATCN